MFAWLELRKRHNPPFQLTFLRYTANDRSLAAFAMREPVYQMPILADWTLIYAVE
jgi:hypothetical protein